jgi:allantoinase
MNTSNSNRAYPTPAPSPPHQHGSTANPLNITVLASSRAVVSGKLQPATVVISLATGKITAVFNSVLDPKEFPPGTPYVDRSPKILLPGIVDAHVHLNEPGRTEWEGFWTGTRAAAFGGVTTVIDMPLNAIPPTTTVAGLKEKISAAQGQCWVDVGFYGGLIPGNAGELKALVAEGVRGFKGFLIDSGVRNPSSSGRDMLTCSIRLMNSQQSPLEILQGLWTSSRYIPPTCSPSSADLSKDSKTLLMFHAEMLPPITDSVGDSVQTSLPPLSPSGPLTSYETFLASRPPSFETYAIAEILSLSERAPKLPLHIVHLSAIEAIPLLREARAAGIPVTAETCFHYLTLTAENVGHGDTRQKCCPPIRSLQNQNGLWAELLPSNPSEPVIQTIVSDHSPCTPALKMLPPNLSSPETTGCSDPGAKNAGDFFAAWGGVSSVGLGLPVLWTEGRPRGLTILDVVRLCCTNTAKQVGLQHRKGELKVGLDGDVAVFDDEAVWEVRRAELLFRNRVSPYEGRQLKGMVRETWLRGTKIFDRAAENAGFVGKAAGELLLEERRV